MFHMTVSFSMLNECKKYTVCNIEIHEDNCKQNRNICKICYNINSKKYNINEKKRKYDGSMNTIGKPKIDNVNNKTKCFNIRNSRLCCYRSEKRWEDLLHVENA